MRKISILALATVVLLTGSLYVTNKRVSELADKVALLIKVGASQSISSLTELTSLSHNDVLPITDTANATTKKVKWGTATSTLKTVFDPIYSPIAGSASLVTLGNVTTGTWNADTLSVAKGGTGSTSLIAYQLLAGNGTGAVTTFGNGTSGYVLTSNGAGALPSFQNVGVTTANNNTWTGTNTFNATTTFSGNMVIGTGGASSTVLMNDANGVVRSYNAGLGTAYSAYATMPTTAGYKISKSINASGGISSCTSATPVLVAEYTVWKYGTVLAYATSSSSGAYQYSILLSKNGLATSTFSTSNTAVFTSTTTMSVTPGDKVQMWCSENNAMANPDKGGFTLYATSTSQMPQISVGTEM